VQTLRAFTAALQSTATEAQLSDETKQQLKTMAERKDCVRQPIPEDF